MAPFTLRFPNSFKADIYFDIDREVVVQDLNSQRVGEFLPPRQAAPAASLRRAQERPDRVWDCCAASGGKSIMAYGLDPSIDLTVSDIRESILANLKKRFEKAGIKKYKSFIIDLNHSRFPAVPAGRQVEDSRFDLIICDAPCTGSGTWSRTPEQLFYFDEDRTGEYAALQKKIIANVIPHLAPGGYLIYITCSVFKKENEEIVEFLKDKFHLQLEKMELLKGYEKKADTMFAALLQKPL